MPSKVEGKLKTTILPTRRVHALVRELADVSGMSCTGIYALGALTLVARHRRAVEYRVKREDLMREIREAFEEELRETEGTSG